MTHRPIRGHRLPIALLALILLGAIFATPALHDALHRLSTKPRYESSSHPILRPLATA